MAAVTQTPDALPTSRRQTPGRRIGRYEMFEEFASGGMGKVHFGRLVGDVGFARVVAIKRLHPHLAQEKSFVDMFIDEARLAARIHHPNVVATLDAVSEQGELLLVMEYITGVPLATLLRSATDRRARMPPKIALRVVSDVLYGLHAAHTAENEEGAPLGIIHRDVSPQNVMVGADGLTRVLDFGIAKAATRIHSTQGGHLKGKLAYMAPEQILDHDLGPFTDVYASSVVLWECLTGQRLFVASNEGAMIAKLLEAPIHNPSRFAPEVPESLGELVLRGLARDPAQRFATARDMAVALESHGPVALPNEVAEWLKGVDAPSLDELERHETDVRTATAPGSRQPRVSATPPARASRAPDDEVLSAAPLASQVPPHREPASVSTAFGTASPETVAPSGRRPVWLVVPVLLMLATGAGAFFWFARPTTPSPTTETPRLGTPAAPASNASTPPSLPVDPSAPPEKHEANEGSPVADERHLPAKAPPAAPAPNESAPKKVIRAKQESSGKKALPTNTRNCDPPYEEDATGIRRVKTECL